MEPTTPANPSLGKHDIKTHEECTRNAILKTLNLLNNETLKDDCTFDETMNEGIELLANIWRKRDVNSEIAFQGLLSCLEYCLQYCFESVDYFENFVNILGYNTVQFWKSAVPYFTSRTWRMAQSIATHNTARPKAPG